MKRQNTILWILGIVLLFLLPGAGIVAVTLTIKSRADFVKAMKDAVKRWLLANEKTLENDPARRDTVASIVAAQAALECGYGSTKAFKEGWNFGNVAKGSSWKGPTIQGGDKEYSKDGSEVKNITQQWRKYDSLDHAVADFFKVIGPKSRYAEAYNSLLDGDYNLYAYYLRNPVDGKGGYYTAPLADYQGGIKSRLAVTQGVA